jgi:hypothetical protein
MNATPLGLMQVVASAANFLPICAVADIKRNPRH